MGTFHVVAQPSLSGAWFSSRSPHCQGFEKHLWQTAEEIAKGDSMYDVHKRKEADKCRQRVARVANLDKHILSGSASIRGQPKIEVTG